MISKLLFGVDTSVHLSDFAQWYVYVPFALMATSIIMLMLVEPYKNFRSAVLKRGYKSNLANIVGKVGVFTMYASVCTIVLVSMCITVLR